MFRTVPRAGACTQCAASKLLRAALQKTRQRAVGRCECHPYIEITIIIELPHLRTFPPHPIVMRSRGLVDCEVRRISNAERARAMARAALLGDDARAPSQRTSCLARARVPTPAHITVCSERFCPPLCSRSTTSGWSAPRRPASRTWHCCCPPASPAQLLRHIGIPRRHSLLVATWMIWGSGRRPSYPCAKWPWRRLRHRGRLLGVTLLQFGAHAQLALALVLPPPPLFLQARGGRVRDWQR